MAPVTAAITHDLAPTGTLRASINLGNPVLAHGTPTAPAGVTVDLARELATRLRVPLELLCFEAARRSFAAMTSGLADVCFLAIDPAREAEVAFTAPYVVIEGVFAVPLDSPVRALADVDRTGVRIGVKRGSAYDLFLTRTLTHATVVRGEEGVAVFRAEGLEVAAGIRQPMTAFVDKAMAPVRFTSTLIGVFAVVAVLLAAIGLYGVLSTIVRQRTAEIGMRMVFGAQRGTILQLIVGEGLRLSAAGIGLGLIAAAIVTRVMTTMLVGVTPTDPLTFMAIVVLFVGITVSASWLPARRASRLDPMNALREE